MQDAPILLGYRYELRDLIGSGGMGTVFRAYDRFTKRIIAIKRLRADYPRTAPTDDSSPYDPSLSLAHEFEMLARLQHPNIISVLDYGFDADQSPYLVMPYLQDASNILMALADETLDTKIKYIVQLFQAMEYLHQHQIIHCDLKPANILLNHDRLVVLDFGLAMEATLARNKLAGTLLYVAPEVLLGEQPSAQADLYAVGLILHQLLTMRHPYSLETLSSVLSDKVNIHPLPPAAKPLTPFLEALLDTNPDARPASATAAIAEIERITGYTLRTKSITLTESFLQTARFVGREQEMQQLSQALEATFLNAGTAWLVSGESGVGKSRLVNELRTLALVRGALVLRGQAVSGGLPYQLWQEVATRLILQNPQADFDGSALQVIVPNIEALTGRNFPNLPDPNSLGTLQRVAVALAELFQQHLQPIVLLLEDLQWANESITLVKHITSMQSQLPHMLIVGTYRDDEVPELRQQLGEMKHLKLPRLNKTDIGDIAYSMLGEVGKQATLIDFLWQETDGNAFFIVEIVRALAEEAGSLNAVGRIAELQSVFTGGLRQLMQRRLERVPIRYRALLAHAAVAGRVLNLTLLMHLSEGVELEDFLVVNANACTLEVVEDEWRFAHEKFREHVLQQLSPVQRSTIHLSIALAIETLYAQEPLYDAVLADHFLGGNAPERALPYALRATKRDLGVSNFTLAMHRAEQLLRDLPTNNPQRHRIMVLAATAHQHLGDFDAAATLFTGAAQLAATRGDVLVEADALRGLGVIFWYQGNYAHAQHQLERSLNLHRQQNHTYGVASCLNNLGIIALSDDRLDDARSLLEESLALYRHVGGDRGVASVLNNLGLISDAKKELARSREYYQETLSIFQELEDRWGVALAYQNLGSAALDAGEHDSARGYFAQSIELKTAIGDQHGLSLSLLSMARLHLEDGDTEQATVLLSRGLVLGRDIGAIPVQTAAIAGYGVQFALNEEFSSAFIITRFLELQSVGPETAAHVFYHWLLKILRQHFDETELQARTQAAPLLTLDALATRCLSAKQT